MRVSLPEAAPVWLRCSLNVPTAGNPSSGGRTGRAPPSLPSRSSGRCRLRVAWPLLVRPCWRFAVARASATTQQSVRRDASITSNGRIASCAYVTTVSAWMVADIDISASRPPPEASCHAGFFCCCGIDPSKAAMGCCDCCSADCCCCCSAPASPSPAPFPPRLRRLPPRLPRLFFPAAVALPGSCKHKQSVNNKARTDRQTLSE